MLTENPAGEPLNLAHPLCSIDVHCMSERMDEGIELNSRCHMKLGLEIMGVPPELPLKYLSYFNLLYPLWRMNLFYVQIKLIFLFLIEV